MATKERQLAPKLTQQQKCARMKRSYDEISQQVRIAVREHDAERAYAYDIAREALAIMWEREGCPGYIRLSVDLP